MKRKADVRVKLVFFRTLFSQSGASLTMGSIAAYLRQGGVNADLCLLEKQNFHTSERVLSRSESETLIVIAKPNFKDFRIMLPMLRAMKKRKGIQKVFLCGPYAVLNAKSIMESNGWVDGIIIESPEWVSLELVKTIRDGKRISSCRGGLWRVGNNVRHSAAPAPKVSLDDLPFPARDIEAAESESYVNIEASRGCLYNCSFCHIPLISGKRPDGSLDVRSPSKVVDEMEYLYRKLRKTLFIFNDSIFWATSRDNERILEFCSQLKRRKMKGISIYIYLRCNPFIDEKVLRALVNLGLVRVFLGVESASERSQKLFRKPVKEDTYEVIKRKLDYLGVNIHIGYIVFEPFATLDEVRSNIRYLYKMGKMFRLGTMMEPVRVVPGSLIHRELLKGGLMTEEQKYESITYGYRFKHKDVEVLHGYIRGLFTGNELGEIAYQFEYFCTTIGLLRIMLKRFDEHLNEKAMGRIEEFQQMQKKMEALLYEFLLSLIEEAGTNGKIAGRPEGFIEEFTNDYYELRALHDDIIGFVNASGGERHVSQIYTGIERVN